MRRRSVGLQSDGSSRAEQHSCVHDCLVALGFHVSWHRLKVPHLFSDIMDLTHLLTCNSDVEVGAHNEQLGAEESEFKNRETLFKRKGINFSTTTNEGRILRSSQVILAKHTHTAFCMYTAVSLSKETDRRKHSRNLQHWKSRKDPRCSEQEIDELRSKPVVTEKGDPRMVCETDPGTRTIANAQQSRREKLMAFLSQKRQIDEEKRKKAKPVFRTGTVHHPYSVYSSAPNLHNQSRMCISSSNLSLMTQSNQNQRRQMTGFSRSSSMSNIRIATKYSKGILSKIIEDGDVQKQPINSAIPPKKITKPKGPSFAPSDHKFEIKLDSIAVKKNQTVNPQVAKETFMESISQKTVDESINPSTVACAHQDTANKNELAEVVSSHEDVKEFRDLLSKETTRISQLCQMWEDKILRIPDDPNFELVKGEVRSVVGQGRLIMKERFHQFSGLVDNCEFRRGEKKTTSEDLRGFWEMIFIQVEDVDRKFLNLSAVEANGWNEVIPGRTVNVQSKFVSKSVSSVADLSKVKPKEASSGLKALIAARRKAAKSLSESEPPIIAADDSAKYQTKRMFPFSSNEAKKDEYRIEDDKTFDGGFFTVKSPLLERKSPRSCKSSSNKLRHAAFTNSTKSVNSLLLSPFISAMSKISLAQMQSSGN